MKGKLDEDQWQEVGAKYEAGERPRQLLPWILETYGVKVSASVFQWNMLRIGANPPGAKILPERAPGRAVVKRGNHIVRHFSAEEDALLRELAIAGVGNSEIGRKLGGRRSNSVRGRLLTLARIEARQEGAGV